MISRFTVTQFSLPISGSALAQCVWRFHASNMNLFLLSLSRVSCEFFDAIDSIRQLSLILLWRFQGPQWLCFRWRFLVSSDVVISDDSMRQRWLFFLLISFVNHELACVVDSVRQPWLSFKHDFSFYSDSVFTDYFWISTGVVCLTIPCVNQESIFAIGFTRRSWILWRCRHHTSAATHISVAISGSTVTLF